MLEKGKKLGPYEIEGKVGVGGMGEVYRARDTRLDRTVAVKVMHAQHTASEEARARFEREARAISSLNHPNLCALYDVGQEGDLDYLVMEYIEGELLTDVIARGAMPPDDVLRYGAEIADALSHAHHNGLIHRDLKPGNIIITKAGAKLLDFGLARATELWTERGDMTQSPTVGQPLTAEGTIVGTFQYMAPEQLEGKDTDTRTDIFAFGAVLYEMATGERAFSGDSQASLIATILKEEPRPMSELVPMAPPALERIVKRCLEKDPDDRWQSTRDLGKELAWVGEAGSQAGVPAPVMSRRRSRERTAWTIVAIALTLAAAVFVPRYFRSAPASDELIRFRLEMPPLVTIGGGMPTITISPDGKTVAFAAADSTAQRLWLRPLDTYRPYAIESVPGAALPFWSADSRHLGYFWGGSLMRVSASGGTPQVLFAPVSAGPIYRVPANGGEPVEVTELDSEAQEAAHRYPQFLPDGEHFLYVSLPAVKGVVSTWIGSLHSKERKLLIKATGMARYAPPGYIVYPRERSLMAQPFDVNALELTGSPIQTGEPRGVDGGWSGGYAADVSDNGILVRSRGGAGSYVQVWYDRMGRQVGTLKTPPGRFTQPAISPDGSQVALTKRNDDGWTADIWLVEVARQVATRFTFHQSGNWECRWPPDGKHVQFSSDRMGKEVIYSKPVGSSGEEAEFVSSRALFNKPETWSPNGKYFVYHELVPETGLDLYVVDVEGGGEPVPFLVTPFNEVDAVVSPNGKWIAYRSDESGQFELYVQSFPEPGSKYRVSTGGAGGYGSRSMRRWRSDGKEIIYMGRDLKTVMSVEVEAGDTFSAKNPRALFVLPQNLPGDATSDCQRFLVTLPEPGAAGGSVSVITNWTKLLEQ
jgi:Tol biopolymer transport system component